MRQYLFSPEFRAECQMNTNDFIRNRLLTCQVLVLFILNLIRRSIAKELISFFETLPLRMISAAAVSKARAKLSPKGFIALNNVLVTEFYTDNPVKTFCNFVVAAIDGSTLQLPINSPEIEKHFGGATNFTDKLVPMARTSCIYDVTNGIAIEGIISPYCTSEREMAFQHIDKLKELRLQCKNQPNFLLLFDRGYPSVPLIVYLLKANMHFVMRCNTKFIKEVNDAVASKKRDSVVKFDTTKTQGAARELLQKLFPDLDKRELFSLRVLVVTLNTGEKEILITSLLDKTEYPYKIFRELYFKRWGAEENYKFQKVILEIEKFSGKSKIAIEQDFHATVLSSNCHALLALEAQEELELEKTVDHRKYNYKINRNVGASILKNDFVKVLMDPNACLDTYCANTKQIMKKNLVSIRPGRKFERKIRHPHHKWHMTLR